MEKLPETTAVSCAYGDEFPSDETEANGLTGFEDVDGVQVVETSKRTAAILCVENKPAPESVITGATVDASTVTGDSDVIDGTRKAVDVGDAFTKLPGLATKSTHTA